MRYRPFGNSGMAVSAISLLLSEDPKARRPTDWRKLLVCALEAGINTFEIATTSPAVLDAVAAVAQSINRRLIFIMWRLDGRQSAEDLASDLDAALEHTGLGYFDLLMLRDPTGALSPEAVVVLKGLQERKLTRLLGVAGDEDMIDAYLATGAFEAMSTTYHLSSGWRERNRIKSAAERNMAIICRESWPEAMRELKAEPLGKRRWFEPKPHPLKGVGTYHFLNGTPGWTAEELCLAYALTEPAITSVQVEAGTPERIQRLAAVTEMDLPTGVAAQIEMARFSPTA